MLLVESPLQGCWSPSEDCGGGALFYAYPQGEGASMGEEARLEYEVYFPAGFTWVKGGAFVLSQVFYTCTAWLGG